MSWYALPATCSGCGSSLKDEPRYILMLVDSTEDPVAEVTACSIRCVRKAAAELPPFGSVREPAI